MVTIVVQPSNYVFSGNPIIVGFESDATDPVTITVSGNNKSQDISSFPILSGNKYYIEFDIAEIVNSFFLDIEYTITEKQVISEVQGFSIECQVLYNENESFSFVALRGGISNDAILLLSESELNIWTFRLQNYSKQFLFTTRTSSRVIRVKDTELYPFIFINNQQPITFISGNGNSITEDAIQGSICSFDISELREKFQNTYNEFPIKITVCPQGIAAFRFEIYPRQISEEKYILKFRNSLGAFELLEVVGKAIHSPEFSDENIYSKLQNNMYVDSRDRLLYKDIIEVETGYKKQEEFPFLLDLVTSDEIYLIYPDNTICSCLVSTDAFNYAHRITTPTSIPISIKLITNTQFVTAISNKEINNRIFDNTFDNTFN